MKLRPKILICLLACVGLFIAIDLATQSLIILPSFERLEEAQVRRDVDRCTAAIGARIESLETLCHDWAAWDDTYAFAQEPTDDYVQSNLCAESYVDNELDVLAVYDRTGRRVGGGVYDLQNSHPASLQELPPRLGDDHLLWRETAHATAVRSGLWRTSRGVMVVSAHPILTSSNEGPSRGLMVMGYFLTAEQIRRLGRLTKVELAIWDLDSDELPAVLEHVPARVQQTGKPAIVDDGRATLSGCDLLQDIAGRPAMLVRARMPREIVPHGVASIHAVRILLVLSTGAFVILLMLVLRWTVIAPLLRLKGHASQVAASGDPSQRLRMDRNDEIGDLAGEFDSMLDQLEQTRQGLVDYQHQLRKLATELSLAEERQRRAISSELHDRIGQSIVAGKMMASQLVESSTDPGSRETAERLSEVLNLAAKDIWSLTFELCPPMLYDVGLEAAVEWLSEQFSQRAGIRCRVQADDSLPALPPEFRGLMFRAVREALTNIEKHAAATEVKIRLEEGSDSVTVTVSDNGRGFDGRWRTPRPGQTGGFGLFGLRERFRQLGGTMDVTTAPGRGTAITLTLPLADQPAGREA